MKKYILLCFILSFSTVTKAQTVTSFNSDNLHFLADIYNESWALLIGINNYQHMPNLNYAVNDAVSIKEMLMSKYNYKEDHIMEKKQLSVLWTFPFISAILGVIKITIWNSLSWWWVLVPVIIPTGIVAVITSIALTVSIIDLMRHEIVIRKSYEEDGWLKKLKKPKNVNMN